ncbi:MAG: alpha-glucoside-specific PTS transporter subunit IIBC [Deltaproteobacteria bacterium]|nr:alpha-glucoside-specific PTS transporter subunit IIBC [Deltaproteobacteria bacterium]
MMKQIQRFGGAMFTPVLLFAFAGLAVAISTLFQNEAVIGSLAAPGTMWSEIWGVVAKGSWTVFVNMPLVFVVGLPIGLARKQNARACLEAVVLYLTFNYFLGQIMENWGPTFGVPNFAEGGPGVTTIAGIKTLDMGILGGLIIAGVVVYLHNRFFDTNLPEWLGIFKGSTFIYTVGFFVMIPVAFLAAVVWPHVQQLFAASQGYLTHAGAPGIWVYGFLNRILIPTGLHHFIYTPFLYDNVAVPGGIQTYWIQHLSEFAASDKPLIQLFPQGGFALFGSEKVFGCLGIALSFYATSRPEKRKKVLGLLIPATLTAMMAGITEPLEFTFLFVAPVLFVIHSVLAGFIEMTMYLFGVVGYFTMGLIEYSTMNWIPLGPRFWGTYLVQVLVGLAYTAIYFIIFSFLIRKFNFRTPGREEDDEETRLFTRADYQEKKEELRAKAESPAGGGVKGEPSENAVKAAAFLDALGGRENIAEITNCATRLRITVKDESLVQDGSAFKASGAHGLVVNGPAVQVIVGLSVPMVREEMENLMGREGAEPE